jgi:hypothetical protein
VPEIRAPLLSPREGRFRNIYAPSIVRRVDGWRVFYGGWDGTDSGNDRIYAVDADADFTHFENRRTVIEHGEFQHVCNVNVARTDDGYAMACTAYPTTGGTNKPVTFFSKDGDAWGATAASPQHLIRVSGYENFHAADVNGMNALLHDGGQLRLYFGDFRNAGKTFRASNRDGKSFAYDAVALEPSGIVNDVKAVRSAGGEAWYLMALHGNADRLFFSLSRDPAKFPEQKTLLTIRGDGERFVTSVGWVCEDGRVLGLLYGAGSKASLDANRIFARWLQRQIVIDDVPPDVAAVGPDRQLLRLPAQRRATIRLLAEDRVTPIAASERTVLTPGRAYRLDLR